MTATIIDGNAIARGIRADLTVRVAALRERAVVPGLAVIVAGDDPASQVYVRNKAKACAEVGVAVQVKTFPAGVGADEVLAEIARLNADPAVHGILLQLPLPRGLDAARIARAIDRAKDVDGFDPCNLGALIAGGTAFEPCTPQGIMRMLGASGIGIAGRTAVVVGRSAIVGKPIALMLLNANATVTVCHSQTPALARHTRRADILVVAAGKPGLLRAPMVKPGAVVVDVGIHRLADGRLVGDVDFEAVRERAGYITPVPGGVGPMTVAALIGNTVLAAERASSER